MDTGGPALVSLVPAVLLIAAAPCKMQPFPVMMVMKRTKVCPSCGPTYDHTYLKRSIILYTKNAQSRPPAGTHPKLKPKILAVFSPKTVIPSKHDVLPVGLACPMPQTPKPRNNLIPSVSWQVSRTRLATAPGPDPQQNASRFSEGNFQGGYPYASLT